jgi:hypothetical protein
MKLLMLFVMFLFIGAFFIISNENIKMNSKENINLFFDKYFSWIDQLGANSKTVVGYVVKMDWLPSEKE